MTTAGNDPAQREHRGVGGKHHQLIARRGQLEAAVERRLERGDDFDPLAGESAVGEPQCELCGPAARRNQAVEAGYERLEVDVPDPRDVAAVGDLVVERDDRHRVLAPFHERPHRLICAGGVLHQEHQQTAVTDRNAFEPPERRGEPFQSCDDLVERRAERQRERPGPESVVDVVEPRQNEVHASRSFRRRERERGPVEPVQLDVARGHIERRPRVPAVRTAVVTEVADVRGGVVVRGAAAQAVLGVGRVLQGRTCESRVVETEDPCAPTASQVTDLWVVTVHDELGVR